MTEVNKNHNANKNYYELVAMLTLKELFPQRFSNLNHSDKPDLMSSDAMLGIEVVRAVDKRNEECASFYKKQLFNKLLKDIPKEKLDKFIALGNECITTKNIHSNMPERIIGYALPPFSHTTHKLLQAITKKVMYIDKTEWKTQNISLYMFTDLHEEYYDNDIKEIIDQIQKLQESKKMKYDILFVDDNGWFYECNLKSGEYKFYNTENRLSDIYIKAKTLSLQG